MPVPKPWEFLRKVAQLLETLPASTDRGERK
jgi:hypothetical protein